MQSKLASRRTHMANERTFLAWTRTALGIMAFGFAIDRFAFATLQQTTPHPELSLLAGLLFVAFGVLLTAFAFIRYRTIEKQLDAGMYAPNLLLTAALTFFVIALGFFLIVYLMRNA